MSAKPRKAAAKKVAAEKAVKITGRKAGSAEESVGPSLTRDKSEPETKKLSKSVSERSNTCASIQVAIGRPLDDLIFAFGHSGGSHLLKQHYLARLTKKEALAILAIGPGGKKIEALNVA